MVINFLKFPNFSNIATIIKINSQVKFKIQLHFLFLLSFYIYNILYY